LAELSVQHLLLCSRFFFGMVVLLLALYNCNGLVAPRLCLYNFWFVFVFLVCSLQLFHIPCAWQW